MNSKLLLLIVIISASCHPQQSNSKSAIYKQIAKADTVTPGSDAICIRIATIDFKLKATKEDSDIFEDGIVPWISLEDPDKEIGRLINASEIVLPYKEATLIIDYPLNKPAFFKLSALGDGFTRKQLIQEISKKYHLIYKEEEESAVIKTIPVEKRKGLINRNETNGKYGICCHDLADLDLSAMEVYKNVEEKIHLILIVES